jgi:hypothetical protein
MRIFNLLVVSHIPGAGTGVTIFQENGFAVCLYFNTGAKEQLMNTE